MENEAGYLVDMTGAIDMHFHPAPCLFPRLATDHEIAEAADKAGFSGLLLKCHHESTVTRAKVLQKEFTRMHIFGGIVLNSYVGGINPKAVEAALKLGGKEVWLPTIDSAYHAKVHGSTGVYDVQVAAGEKKAELGISAVQGGALTLEAKEVCLLVAQHNAILGTCHQSYEELKVIIAEARRLGVEKILLTHPFFRVPGLTLEQTIELVGKGAIAEFGYCTVSPMWAYKSIPQIADAIKAIGAKNCILISDAGQRSNPMPPEALRIFVQGLFECGISEADLDIMIRHNPAKLLDLDPGSLHASNED
jgi:hypothetical protein